MYYKETITKIKLLMMKDSGIDGEAQLISQLSWLLFLKVFDYREEDWELEEDYYEPIIPEKYQWRNWAADDEGITGDDLLQLINELFTDLRSIPVNSTSDKRLIIVREVFEDANNYMKSGALLRQVISIINEIDYNSFPDIYQEFLNQLIDSRSPNLYYTPRALTDFIIRIVKPEISEKVADFACGTGGFLISALSHMKSTKNYSLTLNELEKITKSIHGGESDSVPHLLSITNLFLHDVDIPDVTLGDSLATEIKYTSEERKYDVITMNPPLASKADLDILSQFPTELRSSSIGDLFLVLAMYRLKNKGRAGIIVPDSFLFGNDSAKIAIKKKLLEEFNLHTIVRLPNGAFAPYTSINTNILFFDKNGSATNNIWFYEISLSDVESFSRERQVQADDFKSVERWWNNRKEIDNAYKINIDEIVNNNYDLNYKFYRAFSTEAYNVLGNDESMSFYATDYKADINPVGVNKPENFIEILKSNLKFKIDKLVIREKKAFAKIRYNRMIYHLSVINESSEIDPNNNWFYHIIFKYPAAENHMKKFVRYEDFYNIKIGIKNAAKLYFKNIFLLEDTESEKISRELYADIRQIENKFRYLITVFMVKRYGLLIMNNRNKKQAQEYSSWYNSQYNDFRNIQSFMHNLDMRKLPETLDVREDGLSNEDIDHIKIQIDALCSVTEDLMNKVEYDKKLEKCMKEIGKIQAQVERKESVRNKLFGNVINDEFLNIWDTFSSMRNVIAHNKPVCKKLYEDICSMTKIINSRLDKFKIEIDNYQKGIR